MRIVSKVETLTPAELAEYKSLVTTKTADWTVYEESVDRFLSERKERETTAKERRNIETQLYGLDDLYQRDLSYLLAKALNTGAEEKAKEPGFEGIADEGLWRIEEMREKLNVDPINANFPGGIADFEKLIRDYEKRSSERRWLSHVLMSIRHDTSS